MQACLNGARTAADGAAVPLTPRALADSAARAVAAGATEVAVRPRTPCGRESLSPRVVAPAVEAVRARVPVPVGVDTGGLTAPGLVEIRRGEAWTEPGAPARAARVREWAVRPDFARVDWDAPDAEELAAVLLAQGVDVEAGLRSGTDGPERFGVSPLAPRVRRVLAEVADPSATSAEASAHALLTAVGAAHGRPVLLHGRESGAWPVLRLAGRLGLAGRAGLADTRVLPDGRRACSNAELVTEGLRLHGHGSRNHSRRRIQQP